MYEALAVVTTSNKVKGVRVHGGPIVAYSQCSIGEALSPGVVVILPLVKFS